MRKLLLTGVLLAALFVACQNKAPVGPASVTVTSTTTSTIVPALTASFVFAPAVAAIAQLVQVDGSASTAAPGRGIVAYDWNFGDGVMKTGVISSHDYGAPATYPITLTVTDDAGQKATASQSVTIVSGGGGGTTTTTVLPMSAAVHFVALQQPPPPPAIPADMTLFFQLLSSGASAPSFVSRLSLLRPLADPTYSVGGSYVTGSGIGGAIKGQFVGMLTPAVAGQFTGTMTAAMPGCTGERQFSGPLGAVLQWTAGPILQDCAPSPWTYSSLTLLQTAAPPPTTTTTSSTTTSSTTTSTTTTTTIMPVLPDLNPFVPPGAGGFCRQDEERGLLVGVRNLGKGSAGPFDSSVTFSVSGKGVVVVAPSTGLAPGGSADLTFQIPAECFSPDCFFAISIDSGSAVTETDETNNTAIGTCIG